MSYLERVLDQRLDRRRVFSVAGVLAGATFIAACGGSGKDEAPQAGRTATTEPAPPPRLEVPDLKIPVRSEFIKPADTDPAITALPLKSHYVAFPATAPRGQLFLFMPGAEAPNSREGWDYRLISEQAARNGFHVIGLRYVNYQSPQVLCGLDANPHACFEDVYREIIYGSNAGASAFRADGTKVAVNRANSVENRLLKLLTFLAQKYPQDGWEGFFDGNGVKWSLVVAAGFSHGGGNAGFIAKDQVVARAAMFAASGHNLGPAVRQSEAKPPAAYTTRPYATPLERIFAFGHAADEAYNFALQWPPSWPGLMKLGGIVNIDHAAPPYGGAHLLLSSATATFANAEHGMPAVDGATPKSASGQPLYAPVWQYMCFS